MENTNRDDLKNFGAEKEIIIIFSTFKATYESFFWYLIENVSSASVEVITKEDDRLLYKNANADIWK